MIIKINVGVIGVGSIGQNHAKAYSEIANLIGISDNNLDGATKISDLFNTKCFNDYHM